MPALSGKSLRCAYCHADLTGRCVRCTHCNTMLHRDCWEGLEACPTFGCRGRPHSQRVASVAPPRRRPRAFAVGLVLAAASVGGFIVAIRQASPGGEAGPTVPPAQSVEAQRLLAWGYAAYRERRLKDAATHYSQAIRRFPQRPRPYLLRATARLGLGDFDGAVADATRTLELAPRSGEAHLTRALAKIARGESAQLDLTAAERLLRPSDPDEFVRRGVVRALLGDRGQAHSDFQRAVDLDPRGRYAPLWIAGISGGTLHLTRFAEVPGWGAALAGAMLGERTEQELLAEAVLSGSSGEQARRRCEAYGFLGLLAERRGDLTSARRLYRQCVATGVYEWLQLPWAMVRLKALESDEHPR